MRVNFFDLARMTDSQIEQLYRRGSLDFKALSAEVGPLIEAVRERGDEAVRELTARFDGALIKSGSFRVPRDEMDRALTDLPRDLQKALEVSVANIRAFHERQVEPESWEMEISPGIVAGERVVPIASVGLYVPRGKGSFPSMMMMSGVPAVAAGVERIAVVTPPDRNGSADKATLAAARIIGIDEVYAIGGVQAIAALAFGTETVPRVDKIVGPGSGHVLAAKQLLSGEVDTGLPAGPSESIILADASTEPDIAVTDLLIEAEHGPDSSSYLVTTERALADAAMELIPRLVAQLPEDRRSFCETVFRTSGGVVLARDISQAIEFINEFAPEHLEILTSDPERVLRKVKYAGEALLGPFTPGTLANYSLGPNAILPTSRFARTSSALSVRDFTRRMSYSRVSEQGFESLAPRTLVLARYEGFAAHAAALTHRLESRRS
ncbi:MAG: histidinol dehydrogenase [Deltaproteobacteria bacterium]